MADPAELLGQEALVALCAPARVTVEKLHATTAAQREEFLACVQRLAEAELRFAQAHVRPAAAPAASLLVVTHREGLRDLLALSGNRTRDTPYCCCAQFQYDPRADERWTLLAIDRAAKEVQTGRPSRQPLHLHRWQLRVALAPSPSS